MARLREFEEDAALAAIMSVFWTRGYEGASMSDLETATGVRKQSLYRVFGDKRGMYLAALAAYEATEVAEALETLKTGCAPRVRLRRFFDKAIASAIQDGDRRGCFLCNASLDQAQADPKTRERVAKALHGLRQAFAETLSELTPYNSDVKRRDAAAAALAAAYFGIRVLVRAGAPAAELRLARDGALAQV